MKQIILVRHARALDREKALELKIPDSARPLTTGGIKKFCKHMMMNVELFQNVELLVTSPYERALETLELIVQEASLQHVPQKTLKLLEPEESPQKLITWIKKQKEECIVLVSHEPLLSNFVGALVGANPSCIKIKKGAIVLLEFSAEANQATLVGLYGTP